jgi:hypothetical protein
MQDLVRRNQRFAPFASLAVFSASVLFINNVNAQATLPTLKEIALAMEQNRQKISNVKMRLTRIAAASPEYFSTPVGAAKSPLVESKEVAIDQYLVLLDGDKRFVDERSTVVGDDVLLVKERKFWFDPTREKKGFALYSKIEFLDDKGKIQSAAPAAYDNKEESLPLSSVMDLQFKLNGVSRDISFPDGAKVIGFEPFHGLNCIRVEWGEKEVSDKWGFQLVCPERDWKVLSSEFYVEPRSRTFKRQYDKRVVEKLQKIKDCWVPSSSYHEVRKIGLKGEVYTIQMKTMIDEITLDTVDANLLFTPLFSPGTVLLEDENAKLKGPVKVMGGNIKGIVAELRAGDFSSVEENVGDLTAQ